MGSTPGTIPHRPDYRLFNASSVALAALICSPLAGTILMAVNYRRLGRAGKGVLAVLFGLLATAPAILINWYWKTTAGSVGTMALGLLLFFCTWQIAFEVQGEAVEEHVAAGGRLGGKTTAFLVGVATFAVMLGLISGVFYETQHPKAVMVGIKDQVVYTGLATKSNAVALGSALKDKQYFRDRGATVFVEKGIGSKTLSFAVQDGMWNQAGTLSGFEELARQVAPTVGGLPVEVQLVDTREDVEATSTVGEVGFDGNDGVFYEGTATRDEARELGEQLQSMGFFRGKGANVFLTRHDGDGTTLAFVTDGDAGSDPHVVGSLESIVRDVAPAVGGLPIEMHLVNTQLELRNDELVE